MYDTFATKVLGNSDVLDDWAAECSKFYAMCESIETAKNPIALYMMLNDRGAFLLYDLKRITANLVCRHVYFVRKNYVEKPELGAWFPISGAQLNQKAKGLGDNQVKYNKVLFTLADDVAKKDYADSSYFCKRADGWWLVLVTKKEKLEAEVKAPKRAKRESKLFRFTEKRYTVSEAVYEAHTDHYALLDKREEAQGDIWRDWASYLNQTQLVLVALTAARHDEDIDRADILATLNAAASNLSETKPEGEVYLSHYECEISNALIEEPSVRCWYQNIKLLSGPAMDVDLCAGSKFFQKDGKWYLHAKMTGVKAA